MRGAAFRDVPLVPAIAARLHRQLLDGEGVAFVGEGGGRFFPGDLIAHVSALIDGRRSGEAIAASLAPAYPPEAIFEAMRQLTDAGVIGEAAGIPTRIAALWSELGVDELRLRQLLGSTAIRVVSLAPEGQQDLELALRRIGLQVGPVPNPTLDVVLVEDYLDPRLAAFNAQAFVEMRPWMPVKCAGVNLWVGPVFSPGRSACWDCLATRLRQNRPLDRYLHQRGHAEPVPVVRECSGASAGHGYAMAAMEVASSLSSPHAALRLANTLTILEALTLQVTRHPVVRRPQCKVCGDPTLALPMPAAPDLSAADTPVVSRDGGEHREPPETTFSRYAHHLSAVTGLVSSIQPSPWNEAGPLRSFMAGHNHALSTDTFADTASTLRSWSSGKGRSAAQARTSALCEALERLSGVWTNEEPRLAASFHQLGERAIDPRTCLQFSDRQYEDRDRWLGLGQQFQVVPKRFRPDAVIDWSPVWSVTEGRIRYLPSSYLYFGYPHRDETFFAWPDSNGNAAGTTFADAALQGLYELIERDSVALWWYNRVPRPGVDLDGLDDLWINEVRSWYAAHDRDVWAIDITADLGVPAFAALSQRLSGPTADIVLGFGAHHDPHLALNRALTELNQFMPAVLDVADNGATQYQIQDAATVRWWRTATLDCHPYLRPLRSVAPTSVINEPAADVSAAERFHDLARMLQGKGHEVLVLNQTRPDIGLPVAKVVVPGLRHFWARFAPGRLYDVPVRLGWIDRANNEGDLNPTPMFL